MKYKCLKCNKEFHQKSNYDVHIRRIYPCDKNLSFINDNINNKLNNNSQITHNNSQVPHNNSQNLTISNNINNEDNNNTNNDLSCINNNLSNTNSFKCDYCNKNFTRIDNLTRHLNKYCKTKNIKSQEKVEIQILCKQNKQIMKELQKTQKKVDDLMEVNDLLIKDNKQTKDILSSINNNDTNKLTTQLCKVSKGKTTKNNLNSYNESINNINANNNINTMSNNTINNTINNTLNHTEHIEHKTLVNFGSEDISIIAEEEILGAINTISNAYPSFVTVVHANKKHPQYSNLKIPNLRSNYGMIVEDGKFVTKTFPEILDELKDNRLSELINYVKMFHTKGKISKQRKDVIMKKLEFIQNTCIETEDVDGNIVRCNKDDLKKIKEYNSEVVRSIYDNKETINSNVNYCNKYEQDKTNNDKICNV
jgi:hypothetical protein